MGLELGLMDQNMIEFGRMENYRKELYIVKIALYFQKYEDGLPVKNRGRPLSSS